MDSPSSMPPHLRFWRMPRAGKCHEPAAFLTALLNSQPMGFYSRSSLVQDACRHDVEVLPVDVCISN